MLEDVARDEGLVDARVFVGLEMLQGVVGNALMLRSFCVSHTSAYIRCSAHRLFFRTFARRHGGGLGDRRWERHGVQGGLGLIYMGKVRVHVGESTFGRGTFAQ